MISCCIMSMTAYYRYKLHGWLGFRSSLPYRNVRKCSWLSKPDWPLQTDETLENVPSSNSSLTLSLQGSHLQRTDPKCHKNLKIYIYVTQSREMSHMSKIFNFEIFTTPSSNFKMLHFDANPIKIGNLFLGYLVTELWAIY